MRAGEGRRRQGAARLQPPQITRLKEKTIPLPQKTIDLVVLPGIGIPFMTIVDRAVPQVHHRARDQRKGSQKIGEQLLAAGVVFGDVAEKEELVQLENVARADDGPVELLDVVRLADEVGVAQRQIKIELIRGLPGDAAVDVHAVAGVGEEVLLENVADLTGAAEVGTDLQAFVDLAG